MIIILIVEHYSKCKETNLVSSDFSYYYYYEIQQKYLIYHI